MDLTVYIQANQIEAFANGTPVPLRETPQDGLPVTAPIDEFEISGIPEPGEAGNKQVRWKLAGTAKNEKKSSPFSYWP